MSLSNIRGHNALVLACSSDTLTIVLPHWNTMTPHPFTTKDMTYHPVTVYRHLADLLCYPLTVMSHWEPQLTLLPSLVCLSRPGNPFPTFNT